MTEKESPPNLDGRWTWSQLDVCSWWFRQGGPNASVYGQGPLYESMHWSQVAQFSQQSEVPLMSDAEPTPVGPADDVDENHWYP